MSEQLDDRIVFACDRGEWGEMRRLVEEDRVSVTGTWRLGMTAVMWALLGSGMCDTGVIDFLVGHGCQLGQCDEDGWTEIMYALVYKYDVSMIDYLVQHSCQLGQCDNWGKTEIMHALRQKCDVSILDYLVQNGCQFKNAGLSNFHRLLNACKICCSDKLLSDFVEAEAIDAVDVVDENNWTGLMYAVAQSRKNFVQWFVNEANKDDGFTRRHNIDYQNTHGITALMLSCYRSGTNLYKMLLHVCNPNLQNIRGETALHVGIAVDEKDKKMYWQRADAPTDDNDNSLTTKKVRKTIQKSKLAVVKSLIKAGIHTNIRDHSGRTAFLLVCSEGGKHGLGIARVLHAAGADIHRCDYHGVSPIMAAARNEDISILKWLIEEVCMDVNQQNEAGDTPVIASAGRNMVKAMQYVLRKGASVNIQNQSGTSSLMAVIMTETDAVVGSKEHNQHEDVKLACVTTLLENGADTMLVDNEGQVALHKAAYCGHGGVVKILLEHMVDSGEKDHVNTPLHVALIRRKWEIANLFVMKKIYINHKNNIGKSSLHDICAILPEKVHTDFRDCIENLLLKGACVNSRDNTGATPLFDVIKKHCLHIADLLVTYGSDLNMRNCLGQSILHIAVLEFCRPDTLNWILSFQWLDINVLDHSRLTPLHLACLHGKTMAMELLVKNGADLLAKDRNGLTPLILSAQHPKTLWKLLAIVDRTGRRGILINSEKDIWLIFNFSYYHNTLTEVREILTQYNIHLPTSHVTFRRNDISECTLEYMSLDEWVETHRREFPDRQKIFESLHSYFCSVIVPKPTLDLIIAFINDVFTSISQHHPALLSNIQLTGSAGEGTKVIQADEFDFTVNLGNIDMFEMVGEANVSERIYLNRKLDDAPKQMPVCASCQEFYSAKTNSVFKRTSLLAHFYGAISEALDDPSLWQRHPSIYRLSAGDITAANRNISCLYVAIHDEYHPWREATIDIVPAFYFKQAPSWCIIPEFVQERGCRAVGKWASHQPLNETSFHLGHSMCDKEILSLIPRELRSAYKLTKFLKDDKFCPTIKYRGFRAEEFITSYILKTITIRMYLDVRKMDVADTHKEIVTDTDNADIYSTMCWSRAIFRVLCIALQHGRLESNYIPGFNLLQMYDKYYEHKDTALQYAQALEQILRCDDIPEATSKTVNLVVQKCEELIKEQVQVATSSTPHESGAPSKTDPQGTNTSQHLSIVTASDAETGSQASKHAHKRPNSNETVQNQQLKYKRLLDEFVEGEVDSDEEESAKVPRLHDPPIQVYTGKGKTSVKKGTKVKGKTKKAVKE